jgi:hypothetical protein
MLGVCTDSNGGLGHGRCDGIPLVFLFVVSGLVELCDSDSNDTYGDDDNIGDDADQICTKF